MSGLDFIISGMLLLNEFVVTFLEEAFPRNEGILTMTNGDHIPVARNQKERLIEKYRWL